MTYELQWFVTMHWGGAPRWPFTPDGWGYIDLRGERDDLAPFTGLTFPG